ncbi:MAG TPA: hypothetical protein VE173_05335 [Longimicrobiales bacterium]|nr:hypothetical protein [Longimicrobiales bacterium]
MNVLDQKVDRVRGELSARIDALDHKASRHFTWGVGIQVAIFVTILGSLAGGFSS